MPSLLLWNNVQAPPKLFPCFRYFCWFLQKYAVDVCISQMEQVFLIADSAPSNSALAGAPCLLSSGSSQSLCRAIRQPVDYSLRAAWSVTTPRPSGDYFSPLACSASRHSQSWACSPNSYCSPIPSSSSSPVSAPAPLHPQTCRRPCLLARCKHLESFAAPVCDCRLRRGGSRRGRRSIRF